MEYLNRELLSALPPHTFQTRAPYPWIDMQGSLTTEGYEHLRQTLPEVDKFNKLVGVKRAYGQGPHDRYLLHYQPALELAVPWQEFIAETSRRVLPGLLAADVGPKNIHSDVRVVLRLGGLRSVTAL